MAKAKWRSSLATLIAAVAVPIALSGLVSVTLLMDSERSLIEAELQSSADVLLAALDQELGNQVTMAKFLAATPGLDQDHLGQFHGVARRLQEANPQWSAVVLSDVEGVRQLVNTLKPFGHDLAPPVDPDSIRAAATLRRPVIGPLVRKGRVLDEPFIAIRVPVIREAAVRYVVSVALRPKRLAEIVADSGAGRDGRRVAVFDPSFTIAAHSPDGQMVGEKASPSLIANARPDAKSLLPYTTREGVAVLTALRQSQESGWWVEVASTRATVMAPLQRTMRIVGVTGGTAAILSLGLAVIITRNIRQRIRDEERASAARLSSLQQRLVRMANMAPCLVWTCGADGRVTWVSDRWSDYSGLPPGNAAERAHEAIHPDDAAEARQQFARTGEAALDFESRLRGADGRYRWHRTMAQPLRDADGRFVEWIGVSVDISSAKAVAEALQNNARLQELAKDAAERASRAKSRFLAAASHDLRQPFQAMHLYHAVLGSIDLPPKARMAVDGLRQAMEAGEELLKALMDISSFEAGTVQPAPATLRLAEVVEDVVSEYGSVATQQGLTLRAVTNDSLVSSDRVLLKRMLRNLVNNALRYTSAGGILIGCRRRGERVLLQVWDTGVGIGEDDLRFIFEDFYQAGNPSRDRSRGLGLGLAIVQRTARLLGHEVAVASRPGRGSVFTIALPCAQEQQAAAVA